MQKLLESFEDISEKQFCTTCNCEIQDSFSRVINTVDKSGNLIALHYHYFSPCWDLDLFCQAYPHHRIASAGFSFDSKVLPNPKQLRNMKKNLDLWI